MERTMMTKEKIKAIRICNGYNADLRVKFEFDPRNQAPYPWQNQLYDFITEHVLDLFGTDIYDKLGIDFGKTWDDKFVKLINTAVCSVCRVAECDVLKE